jgi:hypothetical protein
VNLSSIFTVEQKHAMINKNRRFSLLISSLFSLVSLNSCNLGAGSIGEIVQTQYKIPDLNLDFFADDRKDILIDYLTKSSDWHVFPIYETIVAMKRVESKTCNPVAVPFPSSYPFRIIPGLGTFLDLYSDTSKIRESSSIPKNIATQNSQIELTMEKPYVPPDNIHARSNALLSDLIVESKNKKLSLHSFDNSKDIKRPFTTKFLMSTSKELEKLIKFTAKGSRLADESILPPGSTLISAQPMMSIEQPPSQFPGEYNVSGYINPGQKGFIYLKVIHNRTGEILLTGQESTNAEYTGWSNNPNQKFNFCIKSWLRGSADDVDNVSVDFQIWFKPEDRSPEKMLIRQTRSVNMSFTFR